MKCKSLVSVFIFVLLTSCSTAEPIFEESANPEIGGESLSALEPDEHSSEEANPSPTPTTDPDAHLRKYEGEHSFSFVDGSEPGMPIINGNGPGYMPQPGDAREQIVIDETFSIPEGEEVFWEDIVVWIRPNNRSNIRIFGTLIVKNSLLLWDQTEHMQTHLVVRGNGTLKIESSFAFSANQYWIVWDYGENATVLFDNFIGGLSQAVYGAITYISENYSTAHLALATSGDFTIQISDAHSLEFELYYPAGEHEVTLPPSNAWIDWDLSDIWPNSTFEIEHSYVRYYNLGLDPGTHITVRDSTDGFNVGWHVYKDSPGFVDCELHDLGDPQLAGTYPIQGTHYESMTWDLPCIDSSLTVINSRVLQAWPVAWGNVHLRVYNSNLVDPRVSGPATLEIYTSTLENIAAYQGGIAYLENVRIIHDLEVRGAGSVIYGFGVIPFQAGWQFEIFELDGGRYIELEVPGLP